MELSRGQTSGGGGRVRSAVHISVQPGRPALCVARRASHWANTADLQVLQVWDTASCKVERRLKSAREDDFRGNYGPQKLAFSGDSRRLLVVRPGGDQASVFEVDTGREICNWKTKKSDWQAIALSPDGSVAAAGGEDGRLHLWDVATGRELARWPGHDSGVTAPLFSKDAQTLYSGSQDSALKLWNLPAIRQELKALNLDW